MHQKTVIRWMGLLLSLVLVLGLLPAPAFAATEDPIPEPIETATKELPVVLAATDPVDYYGRTALSALPNSTALLYAYDQIAAGAEICAATISVYNGTDPITAEELQTVVDAYRRDYTHHFWMGGGYSYSMSSVTVLSVTPSYLMSGAELEAARAAFDAKVATIILFFVYWEKISSNVPPTVLSDIVNPGLSAFVLSDIRRVTPFFPSSPKRARSIISPVTGVASILKSPVKTNVPTGVLTAKATASAIE